MSNRSSRNGRGEFDCNPLTTAIQILLFPKTVPPLQGKVLGTSWPNTLSPQDTVFFIYHQPKMGMKNVSALEISHWANLLPLQHVSPLNRMADIHST